MNRFDRARNGRWRLGFCMLAAAVAPLAYAVEYTEGPSISVVPFKMPGPDGHIARGIADQIVTGLVNGAPSACKLAVIEGAVRPALETERKLQQRPDFDPATRVEPGRLIDPRYFLEGTVVASPTQVGWSLQLVDSRTKRVVGRYSGQAARDDQFRVGKEIARQVIGDLCSTGADYSGRRTASPAPPPPPPAPASVQGPPPVPQAPPPPSPTQDVQDAVNTMNKLRGLFGR